MNAKKHAYLILAHRDDLCFRTLLTLIDDPRNDIFIHMDSKCLGYRLEEVSKSAKYSNVYHTERHSVTWGGYSMIQAELELLKAATSVYQYQYYHLLSGQDLPIKSQNYIHDFFDLNSGKEFIRFNHSDFRYQDRVQIYHLFQEKLGRNHCSIFNRLFLSVQKIIGIKRNKRVSFYKGDQWFSITDNFVRFILDHEEWVKKVFRYTYCCDEMFVQTLLMMSPCKDNRYWIPMDDDIHAFMRLIDWTRGGPYVFRMSDKEELMTSDMLFCRKFDANIDAKIIHTIKKFIHPDSN